MKPTVHSLLTTIGFLVTVMTLPAQTAFYDALRLRQWVQCDSLGCYFQPDAPAELLEILTRYDHTLSAQGDATAEEIALAYEQSGNPFIGPEGRIVFSAAMHSLQEVPKAYTLATNVFSAVSGVPVTKLADGLAKFLATRTKQELNLAFFARFRAIVQQYPELQTLFPATTAVFMAIGDEIYHLSAYLASFQAAFIQDLNLLPGHIAQYLEEEAPIAHPILALSLGTLLQIAQEIVDGQAPAQIIHNLAQDLVPDTLIPPTIPLSGALRTLDLISQSLQAVNDTVYWLRPRQLTPLINDDLTFALYLGLLYQQAEGIRFDTNSALSLRNQLTRLFHQSNHFALRRHLRRFTQLGQRLGTYLNEAAVVADSTSFEAHYQAIQTMLDLLEEAFAFRQTLTGQPIDASEQKVLEVLHLLNTLHLEVRLKRYTSAIITTHQLIATLIQPDDFTFAQALLKYGSFMATVAQAETTDEIALAIEAIALPAGSASMKKYSRLSADLNAYVGGFYGQETLWETDQTKSVAGISAPIGIALSWGGSSATPASVSAFLSILDVGALTAFRLSDPAAEVLPEVTLSNILAPGAHLIYGFAGLPISLGAGAQLGPNLRQITIDGEFGPITEIATGWRWHVFLAVDIPLINLSIQPR